ncbi:hypothetical protein ZWY2020_051206 [Hordeum vulgare]|nr:hypothetical protein ZWY2020_051206 [Hordeum vulgare]
MEIMEQPEEAAERAGLKRPWSSASGNGSHGFIGVTTAAKKPTLLPHNNVKCLKKVGNGNLLHPDMPDTNALRFSCSSPGGDLGANQTPTEHVPLMLKASARKGRIALLLMKERVLVLVTCGVQKKRLVHSHQLVMGNIEALKKDLKHKVYPT